MIVIGTLTNSELLRIGDVCFKNLLTKDLNENCEEVFYVLALNSSENCPRIALLDTFVVDKSLLFEIIFIVTQYVILVLQFQHSLVHV